VRIQHSTGFALFLTVVAWAGLPAAATAQPAGPPVLVLLQNSAGVPSDVAAKAQAEVVRLYGLIGVEIVWVAHMPEFGRHVRVVCLSARGPLDSTTPEASLGITYGKDRAYVLWHRVERASQKFTASLYNVLAIAIAHELGHMLLRPGLHPGRPDGSHAKSGLMEAEWNSGHFQSASAGLLHFSTESAALIRGRLLDEVTVAQRVAR
jgi:hypothetical protein